MKTEKPPPSEKPDYKFSLIYFSQNENYIY